MGAPRALDIGHELGAHEASAWLRVIGEILQNGAKRTAHVMGYRAMSQRDPNEVLFVRYQHTGDPEFPSEIFDRIASRTMRFDLGL